LFIGRKLAATSMSIELVNHIQPSEVLSIG